MAIPNIMWTDADVSRNPQGTTRIVFNANMDVKKGTLTQEEAFELIHELNSNLLPIGFISLPDQTCLILSSLKEFSDYKNEIGALNISSGNYQVVLRDNLNIDVNFNFSKEHLIKGVSKQNVNGDIIAYWVDGFNFDKYLNITNPIISRDNDLKINSKEDFILLSQFRTASSINIDFEEVSSGGNLTSGVYYIGVQQLDRDENSTQTVNLSNPISITNGTSGSFNNNYDGCPAGTPTSSAIKIRINNSELNLSFPFLRFIVIKKENQSLSAHLLPKFNLSLSSEYVISTLNNSTPVAIDSIINDSNYITSKSITQLDNVLYKANLKSNDNYDLQPYVNNIRVNYITDTKNILDTNDNYRNPYVIFEDKSFMWDEIYALYVSFDMETEHGIVETKAFHLPGRPCSDIFIDGNFYSERDSLESINTVIPNFFDKNDNSGLKKYWPGNQMYNVNPNAKLHHAIDTSDNPLASTNMGFWENVSETYSNEDKWLIKNSNDTVIGSLKGERVRHHRFPESIINRGLYHPTKSNLVNVLGIQLTNVLLPEKYKIKNVKIYYAKRDISNRTILGQSLGLNCLGYYKQSFPSSNVTPEKENVYSSIGNINLNNLKIQDTGPQIEANLITLGVRLDNFFYYQHSFDAAKSDSGYIKCKPFDLLSQNVSINGATHVKNVYRIKHRYDAGLSNGPIAIDKNLDLKFIFDITQRDNNANQTFISDSSTNIPGINRIRKIKNIDYVNNNSGDSKAGVSSDSYSFSQFVNNPEGDRAIWIEMDGMLQGLQANPFKLYEQDDLAFFPLSGQFPAPGFTKDTAAPYLTNICAFKEDLFLGFDNYTLCYTGKAFLYGQDATQPYEVFGGDTFSSYYGERSTLTLEGNMVGNQYQSPVRTIGVFRSLHYYICQSTSNINYRHEGPNNIEKYFPKSANFEILNLPNFVDNWYGYNTDYSSVNDIIQPLIEQNGISDFINTFKNRIIRSANNNPELKSDNYRIWEPGNEYDVGIDKGEIWDINGFTNKLFIQTERSIFQTIGRQILKTENSESFIGSGNIFEVLPQELVSTSGVYGGTQSRFTTAISQYGLMFADSNSGIVFNVVDNRLDEISKNGQEIFFRDNLRFSLPEYVDNLTYNNASNWQFTEYFKGQIVKYNGTIYECIADSSFNVPTSSDWKEVKWKFSKKESILDEQSVGIECVFDYKYRRYILTKKDYDTDTQNNEFYLLYKGYLDINNISENNIYLYKGDYITVQMLFNPEKYDYEFGNNLYGTKIKFSDYFLSKNFTIAYYPELKGWVSFYTYFPNRIYSTQQGIISYKNNFYKHNSNNSFLYFYDGLHDMIIDYPIVYPEVNRLSNIMTKTIVTDRKTNLRKYNKTFDENLVYNSYQCSYPLNLVNIKTQRNSEGYWILNNFRDYVVDHNKPFLFRNDNYFNLLSLSNQNNSSNVSLSKHWSKLKKFVDYWFISRFIYKNKWERILGFTNQPEQLTYRALTDSFNFIEGVNTGEMLRLNNTTIIKITSIISGNSSFASILKFHVVSGNYPSDGQTYSTVERLNNDLLEIHDISALSFKNYR
jgi:hypothetical protein